ncbi:MAG: hypothetical protein WCX12_01735 [Candidatus Paceibacterota bacterium]|jgi:hypothetical protein
MEDNGSIKGSDRAAALVCLGGVTPGVIFDQSVPTAVVVSGGQFMANGAGLLLISALGPEKAATIAESGFDSAKYAEFFGVDLRLLNELSCPNTQFPPTVVGLSRALKTRGEDWVSISV